MKDSISRRDKSLDRGCPGGCCWDFRKGGRLPHGWCTSLGLTPIILHRWLDRILCEHTAVYYISHMLDRCRDKEERNLEYNVHFTGGKQSSFAISVFLILAASSMFMPLTISVRYELDAMAEPHPKVLNLTSTISFVSGSTRIWSFMTSPPVMIYENFMSYVDEGVNLQAGAPTKPVPTFGSDFGSEPTLRGLL